MVYKKFIKRDGKTFGPYFYESYRDENGEVKKRYLGTVDPDKGKKKVNPTLKALLIPTVILLAVVFSVVVYDQIESEELGDFFSDLKEAFVKMYGGVTGLVVEEVEEVVEPEPELEEEPEVEVEEVEVEVEEVEV
ncbi:hypothetical protein KAT36_04700, partial [Candidatus Pacearchaeota archaeon]|nr:hypothetical protein [Candidatus Pacearchaeota archaeon]